MDTDRVVVVTGAAGAIGTELVKRYLENGDDVVGVDISADALSTWREQFGSGARLTTAAADVTVQAQVDAMAATVKEAHGHVDVLVNCAGYFPQQSFMDMDTDDFSKVVSTNLVGMFAVTRAVVPLMQGRGWGRIVNFGSGSVFDGTKGQLHYVSAKAGVVGFTHSLARELGSESITVNVVTPGLTVTEKILKTQPKEMLATQVASRALARNQVPEDLVGPVFFLSSDDSGFITGQTINVDGGQFFI